MDKTKNHMREQVDAIYDSLSTTFNIPVFEDEIAEDEEALLDNDYHCFVYETGEMKKNNDNKTLSQAVTIYYYSENRNDLDERTIDIMRSLTGVKTMPFVKTVKQRLQKKDTDRYIDRVVFTYARRIPVGCEI